MSKLFTGALIAAATLAGMYAVAATTATTLAASFATEEATHHMRIVEFSGAVKRASAEHRAARAKCDLLAGAQRRTCRAEAWAEGRRALGSARDELAVSRMSMASAWTD